MIISETRVILANVGDIDPESIASYQENKGYLALKKALQIKPTEVVAEIEKANLRGRGGAGFPTGIKWKFTAATNSNPKYVICNSDEGEPGTFKDRMIMEQNPHLYLEGLIISGYAIGASVGYIYIRGEYYKSIKRTKLAIKQLSEAGLLGNNILNSGFDFELILRIGAGSYLCGDESTLIESLEGKRGYPRYKPPYPAQEGLFGKPTAVNNAETLANVPNIILRGADWYKSLGTEKCPGTKLFTISGNIEKPGVYECEMGTNLSDLIYKLAGGINDNKKLKAVLLGGAAGTFLPPAEIDIPLCYDSLTAKGFTLGSGAIIVLDSTNYVGDTLRDILRFFAHESCGKCTPCRVGTRQLLIKFDLILAGLCPIEKGLQELEKLSRFMFKTSLCALGQSPFLPIQSAIKHFKNELISEIEGAKI